MGYRAEKEKMESTIKRFKFFGFCILSFCILGLCIFSFFLSPTAWKYYVSLPDVAKRKAGELRIHYLDVGQGDSSLIEFPDGKIMLIDGGDGSGSAVRSVLRYMNALKIKQIDHLILTHADGDHCGGLTEILKHKKVFNAYLPPTFPENDSKYGAFYAELFRRDCTLQYSSFMTDFQSGTGAATEDAYLVRCLYPHSGVVDEVLAGDRKIADDNELSSVLFIEYNGVKALFMGDAPKATETQLMIDARTGVFESVGVVLQGTQILKLSHHGSSTATQKEFLEFLGVKDGVISCGKDNPYGHPSGEALSRLHQVGAKVHRTDLVGHIMITISANGEYKTQYIR